MTRDEAIKIYLEHVGPFTKKTLPPDILTETVEHGIDGMVALGILKLDEPKSVEDRACDALKRLLVLDGVSSRQVVLAIDNAGLRIVEK